MSRIGAGNILVGAAFLGVLGCGDNWYLAISAGGPVTVAIRGTVTDCGDPVSGAEVVFRVTQDEPEQARPIDTKVGPVTTSRQGDYFLEIGPSFAVPGPARVELRVGAAGVTLERTGDLEFRLGSPPRDTVRMDADLGAERGRCPVQ